MAVAVLHRPRPSDFASGLRTGPGGVDGVEQGRASRGAPRVPPGLSRSFSLPSVDVPCTGRRRCEGPWSRVIRVSGPAAPSRLRRFAQLCPALRKAVFVIVGHPVIQIIARTW